ncbi:MULTISPECIES: hypothetical protein [unclassified Sphingomonas]|uniref:hypothetical protein n=1 Tax=unclassified Sphingomonas TaxID=196159 RepID=UPI0021516D5A|nr:MULTISPECIES: hypothetical protein [unclassified Sphingomonas]MCR5870157.1 hypothetical protein [Sphingomonas sp. J344]UUX98154.1 hypothetical protein LRS08_11065 [Sphingomonas sp. J315]
MFDRFKGIALAVLAPVLLVGCAFSPGKFVSTLTILADRSFTFSYQGEVIAVDIAGEMAKGMGDAFKGMGDEDDKTKTTTSLLRDATWQEDEDAPAAAEEDSTKDDAEEAAKKEAKFKAIAEALTKEAGYRSVTYKGDGVFVVDYQIGGKLTHNFLWPYNIDAEVIFPFVVLELRGADTVRVKAPAFGDSDSPGKGKSDDAKTKLDGTFTLVTDGEIVSQNNEDGAKTDGTRRTVTWKATPLSKDAPMAVVKVAPRS